MCQVLQRLEELHDEIHVCRKCDIGNDPKRAKRRLEAEDPKVMLIGQALANKTQRLSGLPYRYRDETVSQTGKRLVRFLKDAGLGLDQVYCTDAVKCFPGKKDSGDREPTRLEVVNCMEWMRRELKIVQPLVVITLGRVAARAYQAVDCEVPGERRHFQVPHPAYYRWKPQECAEIYQKAAREIFSCL
jgi:uracil-DNA glycosylase family 4